MTGNNMYQKKKLENIDLTIETQVIQKKSEIEYLEALIRELEEQYRIELRKKALLKN